MNNAHRQLMRDRYEKAVSEYCHAFCQKHGWEYDPDGWVGEVLAVGDYFVDFRDIKHDIDNNVDEGKFLEWYNYALEIDMLDEGKGEMRRVNYEHFLMGARPYSEGDFERIREAKVRVEKARMQLEECIAAHVQGDGAVICKDCKHAVPQHEGEFCRCSRKGTFHKWYDTACKDYAV